MELSELQQEFLADHRRLTKGLHKALTALEKGDDAEAIALAAAIDEDAGAHMAFEEEIFYPRLAEARGQEFVDRMVSEHEIGQRAVRALLAHTERGSVPDTEREGILENLGIALRHVLSCGTMLSELGGGEAEADREALDRLQSLREAHERWTDRAYEDD